MSSTPTEKPEAVTQQVELLKKSAFIERVMARVDIKKRDAKPTIEAALAVLTDALVAGEDINLPPAGKFRVMRTKDLDDGAQVITLRLRTPKNASVATTADRLEDDS